MLSIDGYVVYMWVQGRLHLFRWRMYFNDTEMILKQHFLVSESSDVSVGSSYGCFESVDTLHST